MEDIGSISSRTSAGFSGASQETSLRQPVGSGGGGGVEVARDVAAKQGFQLLEVFPMLPGYFLFKRSDLPERSSTPNVGAHAALNSDPRVTWAEQQVSRHRLKRSTAMQMNDPLYSQSWHLRQESPVTMNIQKAWKMGYTGKNVNVTVVDEGVEYLHPDLRNNFEPDNSFNVIRHTKNPRPHWDPTDPYRGHGTRCAGTIAAEANNNVCSAGVAYEARVSGIALIGSVVYDSYEAKALSYANDRVDIYSNSWGPPDSQGEVEGPLHLATQALVQSTTAGRQGKGNIFVWSSGNGGPKDDCNADGYVNSIYTLATSAVEINGGVPDYNEHCAAVFASAFSGSARTYTGIFSPVPSTSCDDGFKGTSASTAVASGVIALAIQANPNLTWRDAQHLVIMSANSTGILATDWKENGVGRKVSHFVGYGLMDAAAMVTLAKNWIRVPPLQSCFEPLIDFYNGFSVTVDNEVTIPLNTTACEGMIQEEVRYLESVELILSLDTQYRGGVEVVVTSPMGTSSKLMSRREQDKSTEGFSSWSLLSTHFWGEDPRGEWRVRIRSLWKATVTEASLNFHGTWTEPYPGAKKLQEEGWDRYLGVNSARLLHTRRSSLTQIVITLIISCWFWIFSH